tara:strand:+ start:33 stop:317 length:285 start_codon:yes stop_codon:yes gene_type:complete
MKGYWIARCHVTDEEQYGRYIKLAGPAIEKHGGRFLVRGGDQTELEGGPYERTVMVEFDSKELAEKAYKSEEYQKALKIALDSSDRHLVIVEGI